MNPYTPVPLITVLRSLMGFGVGGYHNFSILELYIEPFWASRRVKNPNVGSIHCVTSRPALTMSDSKIAHRRSSRNQARTETWLMIYDAQVHNMFVKGEWKVESAVMELWSAVGQDQRAALTG